MTFKNFIYNLLRFSLLFGFNAVVFSAFIVPKDIVYFISAAILFAISVYMHKQLLRFLAVTEAFPTRFVTIALLVAVIFFVMETILPGFVIESWNMRAVSLGAINIAPIEFTKYTTMAIIALFDALFASTMYSLESK